MIVGAVVFAVVVAGVAWFVRRRYTVVTVHGDSMNPTYRHGDNPAGSYDSRHFGHIGGDRVRGVVLRRMGG
jgi:hypothetical protein